MEAPNLLAREFEVDVRPTDVLLRCLEEMEKLAEKAILIVTNFDTIRIFAPVHSHHSCAVLDIDSDHVSGPSNADAYSLSFDIHTWILALRAPIIREPAAPLSITKSPGSMDLFCLFGVERREIRLGEAESVQKYTLDLNLPRCVEVIMTSDQFREFVFVFGSGQDDVRVATVEMQISPNLVRCVRPKGNSNHNALLAENYIINGLAPEDSFHFRLRWDETLFGMFCSAAIASDWVEISVMLNSLGEKLYMFRFLRDNARDAFYYVEKEPHPDTHLANGV